MLGTWAECLPDWMGRNGYIVGLTGGIGSGKSTVAALFAKLGVARVDTDAIAHALTASNGRAMATIRARLGAQFVGSDGALDRAVTRNRVFVDAKVKSELEAILHPLIQEEVDFALSEDSVSQAPYTLLEVPLLFEAATYRHRTQKTLLIDCPVASQIERIHSRSGLGADIAKRIIDAQIPRAVRLQLADDVIWNGNATELLGPQVEMLNTKYTQNAGKRR